MTVMETIQLSHPGSLAKGQGPRVVMLWHDVLGKASDLWPLARHLDHVAVVAPQLDHDAARGGVAHWVEQAASLTAQAVPSNGFVKHVGVGLGAWVALALAARAGAVAVVAIEPLDPPSILDRIGRWLSPTRAGRAAELGLDETGTGVLPAELVVASLALRSEVASRLHSLTSMVTVMRRGPSIMPGRAFDVARGAATFPAYPIECPGMGDALNSDPMVAALPTPGGVIMIRAPVKSRAMVAEMLPEDLERELTRGLETTWPRREGPKEKPPSPGGPGGIDPASISG